MFGKEEFFTPDFILLAIISTLCFLKWSYCLIFILFFLSKNDPGLYLLSLSLFSIKWTLLICRMLPESAFVMIRLSFYRALSFESSFLREDTEFDLSCINFRSFDCLSPSAKLVLILFRAPKLLITLFYFNYSYFDTYYW